MLCNIAELLTEVPEAGGLASRCRDYVSQKTGEPDIVIRAENYRTDRYADTVPADVVAYMESAYQFYTSLLDFDGFYLHSSAVALDGNGYLFSGPCGMGKSTHTRLWQQTFGAAAQVFNDDKPALRRIDGRWYAYGTPWCGKDGININMKVPVAGICFLQQGTENRIRIMSRQEAVGKVISQTLRRFRDQKMLDRLLVQVDRIVREVPVYELVNRPEEAAVRLSHETMCPTLREDQT